MTSPALELLHELRARGVTARLRGGDLSLRPREALDEALLERVRALKGELVGVLAADPVSPPALGLDRPEAWPQEPLEECRNRLIDAADTIRDLARSRWGAEADRWPIELLAGLFVRDALAELESALGPWDGWEAVRRRLDYQTGPAAIVRVWAAYAALPPGIRAEMISQQFVVETTLLESGHPGATPLPHE